MRGLRIRRPSRRAVVVLASALALFLLAWSAVPVVRFDEPLSTVVFDRQGRLLSASIASDEQWRFGQVAAVPERFATALTQFEDRRFHYHLGIDPLAIGRALRENAAAGRVVSGGSTLTQQVVRLARGNRPRTVVEKLIEAVLAVRLETVCSKDEILALYAANAPFGGNVVGLEAAAWRYFGRPARNLSWAETAMLAVLPNSPALVHPGRNRQRLLDKRNHLLDVLAGRGLIDELSCSLAKSEPLPPLPLPIPNHASHLLARIERGRSGLSAHRYTTLVRDLQLRATDVIRRHHQRLSGNGVHNLAALVVEVESGQVLAYVGNIPDLADTEHGNHVDLVTAPRSSGSILKPLLYAAMLSSGEILPGQLVVDIPTQIAGFVPQNNDRTFCGAVPAATALARSLNVPAVRMLRSHGVDRFYDLLQRLGMTTLHRPAQGYGLALILGGAEATLWDITGLYAGLARTVVQVSRPDDLGEAFRPLTFLAPAHPTPAARRDHPILGPGACYETLKAMLEVTRPGADQAWRHFTSARRIAWKTGTSHGYRDAWAVGVTPRYAIGVWAGNADGEGRPGLTGHASAAPVLFDLFNILDGGQWFEPPRHAMTSVEVCASSGMRVGPNCATRSRVSVPRTALPGSVCRYCRLVHTDASGSWRVDGACEPVASMRTVGWFVLPPTMEWYYTRSHSDYVPPPPVRPDCTATLAGSGARSLACIYPRSDTRIYVPLELDGGRGRTVFEAAHRDPETRIFWHLDDRYYGETTMIHQMAMAPSAGRHTLTLVDEHGEHLTRTFTVIDQADNREPPARGSS